MELLLACCLKNNSLESNIASLNFYFPTTLVASSLLKTNVKEYIRESQRQLILAEIVAHLRKTFRSTKQLEGQLKKILQLLHEGAIPPMYAAGNLINLFCHLQIDLAGYDFSRLTLHHAYL